jgi:hypothetical protein
MRIIADLCEAAFALKDAGISDHNSMPQFATTEILLLGAQISRLFDHTINPFKVSLYTTPEVGLIEVVS